MASIIKAIAALAAVGAGAAAVAAKAKKENMDFRRLVVEEGGDKAIGAVLGAVSAALPTPKWDKLSDYESRDFFSGQSELVQKASRGCKWRLGYARESLVPEDYLINKYYIAGYLQFPPNVMSGVLDDIAVRVICLDDGSSRGAAVFAVIDCVGISNTDVRTIRARLADFAKENNIASINISAIHCHSAIDTQGLWGELPEIIKTNVKAIRSNRPEALISGKSKAFMELVFERTSKAIKEAFASMKPGKLSYSMTASLDHNRDKRPPEVFDKNLLSLRFVPSDGSRQTVAAFMAAHPVSLGEKNTLCSGDYIYYMEEEVNRSGKNFIFFQGAELAIATNSGDFITEDIPGDRGFQVYGRALGRYLSSIPDSEFKPLSPLLNIRVNEVFVPGSGPVLRLAGKAGIVNNRILKTGTKASDVCFVTEIGYAEIGSELAFALIPGELAPEIQLGGAPDAITGYTHTSWDYPTLNSMTDNDRHLTVIGLCNDSIGYILPDNDFGSMLAKLHYEESVSAGNRTGSSIACAFEKLTDECKKMKE